MIGPWRAVREIGAATLYLGDQRDILEALGPELDGSVILTDPPYSSGGFQDAGKGSGSIGTAKERLQVTEEGRVEKMSVTPKIAGDTYFDTGLSPADPRDAPRPPVPASVTSSPTGGCGAIRSTPSRTGVFGFAT